MEKTEFLKESYDIGYKEGLEEFRLIPYGALVIIDKYREDPQQASIVCLEKLDWGGYLHDLFCDGVTSFFKDEELDEQFGRRDIDNDLFAKGYFEAILDCYDKIKDQL